jgi:hypothetical protein
VSHLEFERVRHRLNEIVAHRLGEGVLVEATWRPINIRHRMVAHRFIYFDSKSPNGLNPRCAGDMGDSGRPPPSIKIVHLAPYSSRRLAD